MHVLYQEAVQCPEGEVAFVDRVYQQQYGRVPTLLREDFCGTALISCEWVKRRRSNHAYGVDLDRATLKWAVEQNVGRLSPEAAARVHLVNADVRNVTMPKVHVVGAFNFSYFIFKQFEELVGYFTGARRSLLPDGLLVLDAYGGYEAQQPMEELTRCTGFTYIWDQAKYNPVNDHTTCHIHFRFADGTQLRKAFSYDWRLWTLGGIQDALLAAGFKSTEVYWEGTTKRGKGNGVFRRTAKAPNTAGWIAYVVGLP